MGICMSVYAWSLVVWLVVGQGLRRLQACIMHGPYIWAYMGIRNEVRQIKKLLCMGGLQPAGLYEQ